MTETFFFQLPVQKSGRQKVSTKNFVSDHRPKLEGIKFISKQHFKHSYFLLMNDRKSVKDLHQSIQCVSFEKIGV